ncbi:aminopeptidase N-like [Formica exsecta]|uniref:aminopeptidase N-like n=1 Tax=Formica exsecta TaxID=72781 RepID=UPI0011429B76|nr:aminopeptidase N-like [Formica exsecta]
MTILKLLLISILYIAAMAIANPTDERWEVIQRNAFNYNSSDYILPLHYEMQLKLFDYSIRYSDYLNGKCIIIIYIIFATQHISFHAPSLMNIINSKLKQINNESEIIYSIKSIHNEDNIRVFNFDNMLLPGIYTLYIKYNIRINEDFFECMYTDEGGYKDRWLIATGFQPKKGQIFPSWDKPKLKLSFNISIMHHQKYIALSNMPIRVTKFAPNDMMWTYFHQTSLISMDSIVFVVSNLQRNLNSVETVNVWCRPQLVSHIIHAQSFAENITMYLENFWNNSRRILEWTLLSAKRKVDHIAIPDSSYEVKQTLGFVFYKESDIIYNEELDPVTRKMIIARLIAREMAQKYIGNLLSPTYWFHLWLNEGFIMFLQTYIIEKTMPKFRMMDLFVVQVQHELLNLNSYLVINSVMEYNNYPENYLFFSLSHIKGSIIWRMLERTLSSDVFSIGIHRYLDDQFTKPKATTSDHLWTTMQTVMNALNPKYQFDIKRMVDSWAMQRCFPVLEVMRNNSRDVVTASIQFHDELDEKQYYIPLTYTTESNLNFNVTWSDVWLTPSYSKFEFSLKKDQWIIFNIQQTGKYNSFINAYIIKIEYLNSEEYRNIHVLNRAQIIDDAFYFAVEKKLDFSIFWQLANYLSKETDYIAWYPMLKIFEFISNMFAFFEFHEFKTKVEAIVIPLVYMKWFTYYASTPMSGDDHTKCLKQELAKWSCIVNSILCRAIVGNRLQQHLTNPEQNKLLPGWKKWTYCNGMKIANLDTSNKLVDKLFNETYKEKNFDHTILECLTYSESPEIIIYYLEKILPKVAPIYEYKLLVFDSEQLERARERTDALIANIFLSILARNTQYMLKDILKNFKKVKFRRVNDIAALTVIINNVYSKEQFDEIRKFVKDELETELSISAVKRKLETRSLEIDRQTKYFQSLFSLLKN